VIDLIPDGRRVSVERETFPLLASRGELYATSDGAYWLDTGTPEAYLQAQFDLLEGKRAMTPHERASKTKDGGWQVGTATIEGSVDAGSLVGEGAVVQSGAEVSQSVIGARCILEEGASVERSVLLPGARVGAGARIESSIIGPRAVIGSKASVTGVSIIGDGFVLAEGTQVSGGRLPESAPNLSQ
jgi:mannose-1-phosphate guanylyltransferase